MKRIGLVLLVCILFVMGCKDKKAVFPEELQDKEWLFYDEVVGESQVLNFNSDGSYSYHCKCGEPIGNSEIEVISFNEHHLMVKIDGELKDFNTVEFDATSNFYWMEGEKYFSGYQSFSEIIEVTEDSIKCAPHGYDPQGLYKDGPFEEYMLADEVEYAEITITSWQTVEDGFTNEDHYEKADKELSKEDLDSMMENGGGSAFLWFNEELEIEKILFWGETRIVE